MALMKELINILDNKDEPITKRLKIANNAFKSNELPVQNREVILIKWISKLTESNDIEVWNQCNQWVSSEQMKDLSRSDINLDDIHIITQTIVERLQSCEESSNEITNVIINIAINLIENRVLQQHFQYDLNNYFEFISNIINNIQDEIMLLKFIKNNQLFNKHFIADEKFHKVFIDKTLILLSNAALKFENNSLIFEETSKIFQKCLFHKNFKLFEIYFKFFFEETENEEKPILPKLLLRHLKKVYALSNRESTYCYKLIFHAFCTAYHTDFAMIYKFTILLISNLGFDLEQFKLKNSLKVKDATLEKSLGILTGIFEILSKNNNSFDYKVNDVSFTNLLQNLLKTIIKITEKPNLNSLKLLNLTIAINPLVIEPIISVISVYIMLSNLDKYKTEYTILLNSIFEVFSKLHRIQNLISKMTPALKDALSGKPVELENVYSFCGTVDTVFDEITDYKIDDILPKSVMEYFTLCITSLASWQVMNLYKTLLFHLDNALDNDIQQLSESTNKSIYIEIICTLMCEFLSSVRIAEHTVPVLVVEKFLKSMDEQKIILGKFGTALVAIEHNHSLMRAYLNICYTWAELYINLKYYSLDQQIQLNNQLHDNSACNITYLHSYLTSEQWCLISERITNFGERPCKQIMQKLCVQKLRAMLIFEPNFNDDILSSITNNISTSIEDYYDLLVNDKFSLSIILPKMGSNILTMSDYLLNHIIKFKNFDCLKTTKDSLLLSQAMLYSTLANINKLFKIKRKHNENSIKSFISTKIFSKLKENELDFSNQKMSEISDILNAELLKENDEINLTINEEKLLQYLNVVKELPVMFLSENVQSIMYMYFASILCDLKKSSKNTKKEVENILLGIVQNGSISLPNLFKTNVLMIFIIKNFDKYNETFEYMLENSMKNEDCIQKLKKTISYLVLELNDFKKLRCCITTLKFILKHKKSKISPENKVILEEYKQKICLGIMELLDQSTDKKNIEAYAIVLKIYLTANDLENFNRLKKHLHVYVTKAVQNVSENDVIGFLILFSTILQHKAKFEDIVEDNFILNIWDTSVTMDIHEKDVILYSKLMVSIFEHIPNEQFSNITSDLLKNTLTAWNESNFSAFSNHLRTWNSILGCSFNSNKTKIWQEAVQTLLLSITENCKNTNIDDTVVKYLIEFEINLIQTTQLLLTPSILDTFFYTISNLIVKENNFHDTFTSCISILEGLLKYRKAAICDRLPSFLQQYRKLLIELCKKSNSNVQMDVQQIQHVQDCAHQLEKLTKNLTSYNKHMASVSIYVISDILKQYETVTLYPGVKLHLNNCLYSLMSLCDQHAISCLMRVLSIASTEIFKLLYETYKKYYRFTGKV